MDVAGRSRDFVCRQYPCAPDRAQYTFHKPMAKQLAKALDRTPNEIYRMLDRLVRRNYVRRTPGDR